MLLAQAGLDCLLHARQRVFGQQLQDADVLPRSRAGPVASLQRLPQSGERFRQLPVPQHRRVVQRRRPPPQADQVVQRVEHLLVAAVTPRVPRHHLPGGHHLDPVDVTLDRDAAVGAGPRHAVAVLVEPHRPILVHAAGLDDAGVERVPRQRQGRVTVAAEPLADRLLVALDGPAGLLDAALSQVGVERAQVRGPGHRRGPLSLQHTDPGLDVGLLVAPGRHAEQRVEQVVAGQRRVPQAGPTLPPLEDLVHHRPGVVPPDLVRHAAEEGKRLDHAGQDRLGPLGRQSQGEGVVGVRPDQDQHRDLTPAFGEVDVDVAEVGLQPLAGVVGQRDERLAAVTTPLADVPADLVVAAGVAVLVLEAAEDLHGGVPLLGWGLLVLGEDGVDGGVEGAEHGGGRGLLARVGPGLRLLQGLADLAPGVAEGAGDLANASAVAVRATDGAVVVHRQHPCLRCQAPGEGAYCNRGGCGGSIYLADPAAGGGPGLRADYQARRGITDGAVWGHCRGWRTPWLRPCPGCSAACWAGSPLPPGYTSRG